MRKVMRHQIAILATLLVLMTPSFVSGINIVFNAKADVNVRIQNIVNGEQVMLLNKSLANGETATIENKDINGMFLITTGNKGLLTFYQYFTDNKQVTVDVYENSCEFSKSTPLNKYLIEWNKISGPAKNVSQHFYASTNEILCNTELCFTTLNDLKNASVKFLKKAKKLDKESYKILNTVVNADVYQYYMAYTFVPTVSAALKVPQDIVDYCLANEQFASGDILKYYPYPAHYISNFVKFSSRRSKERKQAVDYLNSDRLKTQYLIGRSKGYKTYGEYENLVRKYGHYFVTEIEKQQLVDLEKKLSYMKPGVAASNFEFPDVDGKMVKLSDFKGKLVYIDIWATWCGPCKREIPYLKKLEEKFHGKDIVFVSISADTDKEKWEKFVKADPHGVQLIDSKGVMGKTYNFGGIPYFILIDKGGNIIQLDAPRPSSGAAGLIEKWLDK